MHRAKGEYAASNQQRGNVARGADQQDHRQDAQPDYGYEQGEQTTGEPGRSISRGLRAPSCRGQSGHTLIRVMSFTRRKRRGFVAQWLLGEFRHKRSLKVDVTGGNGG